MKAEWGFILTRCVRTLDHNRFWNACVRQIRRFHGDLIPIYVIDDHSTMSFVNAEEVWNNVNVVESEFPGAGELLPYYYLWKHEWMSRAVILQDSTFLQEPFQWPSTVTGMQSLWHFSSHQWDETRELQSMCAHLKHAESFTSLIQQPLQWWGCFGSMTVVDTDFLTRVENLYGVLSNLIGNIRTRLDRMSLERIWGLVMALEGQPKQGLFGEIMENRMVNHLHFHDFTVLQRLQQQYDRRTLILLLTQPVFKIWAQR